jgi:hypothetical protein
VCTWADLTAVIGFHPNLKPLQRHKGVGLRTVDVVCGIDSPACRWHGSKGPGECRSW